MTPRARSAKRRRPRAEAAPTVERPPGDAHADAAAPLWRWLLPVASALVTLAVFWPVLGNQFLDWDDDVTLVREPDTRCVFHERNRGKGAALRTGFAHASGEVLMVQNADLEYDPADYPLLLQPILAGQAHRVLYFWHSMGNRVLPLLSNVCTNLNLTDMESGYKLFTREVVERVTIQEDRFGFEPEIVAKVARLRCRVYEVGVSYAGRTYEDGKKVTWRDGVRALWCIVKYSWLSRG